MSNVTPMKDWSHLIFTGEVPKGYKLIEDLYANDWPFWGAQKKDTLEKFMKEAVHIGLWVCLLDTGVMCFADGALRVDTIPYGCDYYFGKGVGHYVVVEEKQ